MVELKIPAIILVSPLALNFGSSLLCLDPFSTVDWHRGCEFEMIYQRHPVDWACLYSWNRESARCPRLVGSFSDFWRRLLSAPCLSDDLGCSVFATRHFLWLIALCSVDLLWTLDKRLRKRPSEPLQPSLLSLHDHTYVLVFLLSAFVFKLDPLLL